MSLAMARRGARAASRRRFSSPPPPVTAGLVSHLVAGQGLTVDGSSRVSAWADQTGLGNGATQATAINQPTVGADAEARPVVQFLTDPTAANSAGMKLAAGVTFNARDVSVFVAARLYYGGNSAVFNLSNYSGAQPHMRFTSTNANTLPQTLQMLNRDSLLPANMQPTVLSLVSSAASGSLGMGPDLITGLTAAPADADCLGADLGNAGGFTYQNMDVYEVLVYSRALTTQEAADVRAFLAAKYATRTAPWTLNVAFEGDSITQGTGTIQHRGYPSKVLRPSTAGWRQTNLGVSGATVASMAARGAAADGVKRAGARNVLVAMIGRNDVPTLAAADIYASLVSYVQARVTAGWEVWAGTLIATTSNYQPTIDTLNGLIRGTPGGGTGPGIVADAGANRVIDFGALPQFDTAADSGNATYYQGDQTHPTAAGAQLMADLVATQLAA